MLKEGIYKRYLEIGSRPKNEEAWDRLILAAIEGWDDLEKDLERAGFLYGPPYRCSG